MFTIKSLDRLDRVAIATANPATTATSQAVSAVQPAAIAARVARVAAVAVADRDLPELSAVQESMRLEVLSRLETHPEVVRAFVCRFESDVLIVSLAVCGIGTCELSIPRDRFNQHALTDFAAVLQCLEQST